MRGTIFLALILNGLKIDAKPHVFDNFDMF